MRRGRGKNRPVRCRRCGRRIKRRHAVMYRGHYYGQGCWKRVEREAAYLAYVDSALAERMEGRDEEETFLEQLRRTTQQL